MSKKMMIFYSFPFNFLCKSLMTLMTMTLMTGFLSFLYPMQLVTPSVVAIAVRMLLALRFARSSAYLASSMLTKEAALLLIIFSIPYIYK